jgi:hypothetical protein
MAGTTLAKARQPWKSMASSPVDFVKKLLQRLFTQSASAA